MLFRSGVDVLFGGGAENFIAGDQSYLGKDYYQEFRNAGYNVVFNKTDMENTDNKEKTLGIFTISNLEKWVDREVLTKNLVGQKNSPTGDGSDALDQPGLKEMTLKVYGIITCVDQVLTMHSRPSISSMSAPRMIKTRVGTS